MRLWSRPKITHVSFEELVDATDVPPRGYNSSFSACLFVKDDNHRLVEWIAYHYHVLPLRYLVIGMDGSSRTTPSHILDRWKGRMTAVLWHQDVFAPPPAMNVSGRDSNVLHLRRQMLFYRTCVVHLKQMHRTYTAFWDTDECLGFNYPPNSTTPPTVQKDYQGIVIPSVKHPGIVYQFLDRERHKAGSLSEPCITIPRLRFGSKERPSNETHHNLDTLRYSAHGSRDNVNHNGLAKVMMDVSRITERGIDLMRSPHTMVKNLCWNAVIKDIQTLFRINHYIGSWEAFNNRDDARNSVGRGRAIYDASANLQHGDDDNIRSWFDGFTLDEPDAMNLIEGAGALDMKRR